MKSLINSPRFKRVVRFIPIEKTLNLFKYSKNILKKLNMNKNCIKYYKILKPIFKVSPKSLFDIKILSYILRNELTKENAKCLYTVRDFIFKQNFLYKDDNIYKLDSDNLNLIINIKMNKKNLNLIVDSNLILSEDEEKLLFERIKPDKAILNLIIEKENKIINRFFKEMTKFYSLNLFDINNNNLLKEILSVNNIHLIKELFIVNCNLDNDNRKMLFGNFLPKCTDLKTLILNDFPKESENFGNFLQNCKSLEELQICFNNYNSFDTLNYMLLNDNHMKKLKLSFDCFDEINILLDFSFIKRLQNLEYFELLLNDEGIIYPKNLFNGLNNIKALENIKFDFEECNQFEAINDIRNPSLKSLDIFCKGFDLKKILENNENLQKIDINYFDDISDKKIKFPENLKTMILKIVDDKILFELFKQIQIKPIPLLELDIRVEWLLGKITNNTLHEMANAFKYLPLLKKLLIKGISKRYDNENKRNTEWLQNLKFLKNLEYFEIMYYGLTIEELEIFMKSIQNLEFLFEIYFNDNNFSKDKVIKLLKKYKLPPQLRYFNIFSQCIEEKQENENNDENYDENNDENVEEMEIWPDLLNCIKECGFPQL